MPARNYQHGILDQPPEHILIAAPRSPRQMCLAARLPFRPCASSCGAS